MPPKPKVTKEQIETAALGLVREGGGSALTAKALAARLGCSTQPVFWHFRTMEELRGAVFGRVLAVFGGALRRAVPDVSPYLAVGLNYIRFAAEEPALFRLLFMSDFGKTDMVGAKVEMDYILSVIEASDRVTGAAAQALYREMWLFSHGIAAMIATGTASFSESEVRRMLGDVHRALIRDLERNDSEK